MPWTHIADGHNTAASSTTLDVTLTATPALHDVISVQAGTSTDNATISGVRYDPLGLNIALTLVIKHDGAGVVAPNSLWRLLDAPAGGSTLLRITWGSSIVGHACASVDRPSTTPVAEDGAQQSQGGPGTASDSGSGVLTTGADDLLIGALQVDGNHGAVTPGGDNQGGTYTERAETTRAQIQTEYVTQPLTYDAKTSWATSNGWDQIFAACRLPATPPPPPTATIAAHRPALIGPLFSLSASGDLGHTLTYAQRRGTHYVHQTASHRPPRTQAQDSLTRVFVTLSELWQTRSPILDATWEALAVAQRSTARAQWLRLNVPALVNIHTLTPILFSPNTGSQPTIFVGWTLGVGFIQATPTYPTPQQGWAFASATIIAVRQADPTIGPNGPLHAKTTLTADPTINLPSLTPGLYLGAVYLAHHDPLGRIRFSSPSPSQLLDVQ